jgi:hypothetical protein
LDSDRLGLDFLERSVVVPRHVFKVSKYSKLLDPSDPLTPLSEVWQIFQQSYRLGETPPEVRNIAQAQKHSTYLGVKITYLTKFSAAITLVETAFPSAWSSIVS